MKQKINKRAKIVSLAGLIFNKIVKKGWTLFWT